MIDMVPAGPLFHKPRRFLSARQTIYTAIFIGILSLIIRTASAGVADAGGSSFMVITGVFDVVIIVLVKQMSLCKKWARTAMLILYVLAILCYPVLMIGQLKVSMLVGALFVIQAALIIYACVLLYNKECNEWFNSAVTASKLP